jgi:hypothetical protein
MTRSEYFSGKQAEDYKMSIAQDSIGRLLLK